MNSLNIEYNIMKLFPIYGYNIIGKYRSRKYFGMYIRRFKIICYSIDINISIYIWEIYILMIMMIIIRYNNRINMFI
jgi:hypothetical protein